MKSLCNLGMLSLFVLWHGIAAAEAQGSQGAQGRSENRPRHEMAPASASEPRPRHEDSRQRGEDPDRRSSSRLSPEERKALRQQINEAGQDLYQQKRP
jgi:hypothetical protein